METLVESIWILTRPKSLPGAATAKGAPRTLIISYLAVLIKLDLINKLKSRPGTHSISCRMVQQAANSIQNTQNFLKETLDSEKVVTKQFASLWGWDMSGEHWVETWCSEDDSVQARQKGQKGRAKTKRGTNTNGLWKKTICPSSHIRSPAAAEDMLCSTDPTPDSFIGRTCHEWQAIEPCGKHRDQTCWAFVQYIVISRVSPALLLVRSMERRFSKLAGVSASIEHDFPDSHRSTGWLLGVTWCPTWELDATQLVRSTLLVESFLRCSILWAEVVANLEQELRLKMLQDASG